MLKFQKHWPNEPVASLTILSPVIGSGPREIDKPLSTVHRNH